MKWNIQDRKRRNYYYLIRVGIKELILIYHSAQKGPPPPLNSIKGSLLRCHSVNPRQYCSNLFSHHLGCYYFLFTCLGCTWRARSIIRRLRSSRWVKEIGCIECRLTLRRMSRAVSDTDVEHLSHAYAGSVQGFTSLKSPDSWRATGRRKKPLPSLLSHSRRPMIICKKTMQSKQFLSHEDVCSQKSMLLFGDGSALWGWSTHSSSSAIIF